MKAFRVMLLVAAFVAMVSYEPAEAQVPGFGTRSAGLLSTDAVGKLNLTAEQKEKYEKISTEYAEKSKENSAKARDAFKDKDKFKENLEAMRTESQKLRTDYLAKVEGLLTSEQKKTFEEVKNQQPQRGGFGQGGAGGFGGRPAVGAEFLPAGAQERLKLDDAQKQKVADLQKEMESKILNVLTEEQKKQYEEMKKGPGPGGRPGAPGDKGAPKKSV